jgi:hypothetical protein
MFLIWLFNTIHILSLLSFSNVGACRLGISIFCLNSAVDMSANLFMANIVSPLKKITKSWKLSIMHLPEDYVVITIYLTESTDSYNDLTNKNPIHG